MTRNRILVWALVSALPALGGCITGDGALLDAPAPPFTVTTLDGVALNESSFRGQWLILDLMASWCGPCKLEMAHLKDVQATFGDRVAILSVDADPSETEEHLHAFKDEFGTDWHYAADPSNAVARAYNLRTIPKMILIDPDGVVRFEGSGEVFPQTLARVIEPTQTAASPVIVPTVLALAAGAVAAFNPFGATRRAALWSRPRDARVALGFAAAGAVVALALAFTFSKFLSGRATYGSLGLGAGLVLAAAYYPTWARKERAKTAAADAAPPHPAAAAGDLLYYAAPALVVAVALGLRGTGWLPFVAPGLAAVAGVALGYVAERRGRVDSRWGIAALIVLGVGLAALGLDHGLPE